VFSKIISNLYKLLKQKDEQISMLKADIESKEDLIEKKDDILQRFFKANLS